MIKNEQLNRFKLNIKPEILPGFNGKLNKTINPIVHQADKHFSIAFHFPHQRLKSLSTASGFTSSIETSKYYLRKYFLANIEVLKRRNKPSNPCIDGNYDKEILQRTTKLIGCKPPVYKLGDNITSTCNKKRTLDFQIALINKYHPPPCTSIQSISEFHGEMDVPAEWMKGSNSVLMLDIHIQNQYYKQMVYRQDYSLESLIGNSGGYIG